MTAGTAGPDVRMTATPAAPVPEERAKMVGDMMFNFGAISSRAGP